MFPSSKIIKMLFYSNIIIFVLTLIFQNTIGGIYENFALYDIRSQHFNPIQLITHMFMHGGFLHIIFNMFALISFGPYVEEHFGKRKFLLFYLLCGLGAAFLHMLMIHSEAPMVGASGAIYGLMLVYAILYPNEKLFFFFIPIGIKAKYLIGGFFLLEVVLGFLSKCDGVGHFAHVGGGLTGLLLFFINRFLPKKRKKRWT